jgi:predicted nucleic acid-binding protein
MSGEFLNTNILVYAFDTTAGTRHEIARELVDRLLDEGSGLTSIQVLQELLVTLTRKVPSVLPIATAVEIVEDLGTWPVFVPAVDDVVAAARLAGSARISFWDAMIVHAAASLGASVLWSEDLSSGQILAGVPVRNPFA